MGDFELHTNGHCFLCMNKISIIKLEPESGSCRIKSSVQSLQLLSRFLKMDRRKVFDEENVVPPDLLAKVENATLKVELCGECMRLNEAFSKVYRQLEKIEMEVTSCVAAIRGKLLEAKETVTSNNAGERLDGKLKIAEVLTSEAKEKCFQKVKAAAPKIKMQKFSVEQVNTEKHQIKSRFLNRRKNIHIGLIPSGFSERAPSLQPETTEGRVTEERLNSYSDPEENFDTGNDYFDDHGSGLPNEDSGKSPSFESAGMPTTAVDGGGTEPEVQKSFIDESKCKLENGKYTCKLCFKNFCSKSNWRVHFVSTHHKVRYKCNLCGVQFTQRGHYKQHHQNIHVGMKFKCLICNKMYSRKTYLTKHQRTSSCKT